MTWQDLADDTLRTCIDTFGETVTYFPKRGGSHSITVGFFQEEAQVELIDGIPVQTTRNVVGLHGDDLPVDPEEGDQVLRANQERWTVRNPRALQANDWELDVDLKKVTE